MQRTTTRTLAAACCALAGWLVTTPVRATDAPPADASKALYLKYCGACHGPEGKGDGIAGTFMRPKPIDLTQIAKKNGGEFPFQGTMRAIDGSETVRAHGDPEMPVWGEIFRTQAAFPVDHQAEVRGKLMMITDYIRSVQEK